MLPEEVVGELSPNKLLESRRWWENIDLTPDALSEMTRINFFYILARELNGLVVGQVFRDCSCGGEQTRWVYCSACQLLRSSVDHSAWTLHEHSIMALSCVDMKKIRDSVIAAIRGID